MRIGIGVRLIFKQQNLRSAGRMAVLHLVGICIIETCYLKFGPPTLCRAVKNKMMFSNCKNYPYGKGLEHSSSSANRSRD